MLGGVGHHPLLCWSWLPHQARAVFPHGKIPHHERESHLERDPERDVTASTSWHLPVPGRARVFGLQPTRLAWHPRFWRMRML